MTDVERLLSLIPWGERNAVSREALATKLGMSDRRTRKLIEAARREGYIIIHYSEANSGYFRTKNISEIKRYYLQEQARAVFILTSIRACRSALKAMGVDV